MSVLNMCGLAVGCICFFRWRKFVETNDHAAAILLCFGCYVPIHLPKSLLVALLHYT